MIISRFYSSIAVLTPRVLLVLVLTTVSRKLVSLAKGMQNGPCSARDFLKTGVPKRDRAVYTTFTSLSTIAVLDYFVDQKEAMHALPI